MIEEGVDRQALHDKVTAVESTPTNTFIDISNLDAGSPDKRHIAIDKVVTAVAGGRTNRQTTPEQWTDENDDLQKCHRFAAGSNVDRSKYTRQFAANANRLRELGFTVDVEELSVGQKEKYTDQSLVTEMQRCLINFPAGRGRVWIVITGDGNDNAGKPSFFGVIKQALRWGYTVELHSWKDSLNCRYLELAGDKTLAGNLCINCLDDEVGYITTREAPWMQHREQRVSRGVPSRSAADDDAAAATAASSSSRSAAAASISPGSTRKGSASPAATTLSAATATAAESWLKRRPPPHRGEQPRTLVGAAAASVASASPSSRSVAAAPPSASTAGAASKTFYRHRVRIVTPDTKKDVVAGVPKKEVPARSVVYATSQVPSYWQQMARQQAAAGSSGTTVSTSSRSRSRPTTSTSFTSVGSASPSAAGAATPPSSTATLEEAYQKTWQAYQTTSQLFVTYQQHMVRQRQRQQAAAGNTGRGGAASTPSKSRAAEMVAPLHDVSQQAMAAMPYAYVYTPVMAYTYPSHVYQSMHTIAYTTAKQ